MSDRWSHYHRLGSLYKETKRRISSLSSTKTRRTFRVPLSSLPTAFLTLYKPITISNIKSSSVTTTTVRLPRTNNFNSYISHYPSRPILSTTNTASHSRFSSSRSSLAIVPTLSTTSSLGLYRTPNNEVNHYNDDDNEISFDDDNDDDASSTGIVWTNGKLVGTNCADKDSTKVMRGRNNSRKRN